MKKLYSAFIYSFLIVLVTICIQRTSTVLYFKTSDTIQNISGDSQNAMVGGSLLSDHIEVNVVNSLAHKQDGSLINTSPVNFATQINHPQICPELVINGGFESVKPGFTSGYVYCNLHGCLEQNADGKYAMGIDPKFFNFGFLPVQGNGNFMMVNGATTNKIVWSETVNVDPNSSYKLSFMLSVLALSYPPKLNIFINGRKIGTTDAVTDAPYWSQFETDWLSGNRGGQAKIEIIDVNTETLGNDFGLDEISFKKDCVK